MDKLRAIKFFCRTVEAKSFTLAARELGVPQSVLSKSISALEADLQFTLFNRSTRHLSVSEAGVGEAAPFDDRAPADGRMSEAAVDARTREAAADRGTGDAAAGADAGEVAAAGRIGADPGR